MQLSTIKRKIRNLCIISLIIIVLMPTTMGNIAFAVEAGAVGSESGKGTTNFTTGPNSSSIKAVVENTSITETAIKNKMKEALPGKSDAEIDKLYAAATDDTNHIKVNFNRISPQGTTYDTLTSVEVNFTDEEIEAVMNGTYVSNLATNQDHTTVDEDEDSELEGADKGDIGGVLFGPIAWLLQAIGDTANQMIQRVFMGTWDKVFFDTGFLSDDKVQGVVKRNPPSENLETVYVVKDFIDSITGKYGVPEIRLTPAEIFAGNVAALDANFFETGGDVADKLGGEEHSIVVDLKPVVAKWYIALRNIAIVGLLSVLLYVGIRIIISSSAGDKAKYKQLFVDWVIALCLIFFMHYIMAFTMTMSETITDALAGENTQQGTIKQVNIKLTGKDGTTQFQNIYFSSNFTGVARIKADYQDSALKMGYTILYVALTGYTVYFAFVYLKRLLMLAFFTMFAPLVALTYPIDKVKDGKAQAFNYWFKEYMFYALLQPIHMVLYTVLIGSALNIATNNLLYAIVALAFIVPAEKILKSMFGIKGQTESSISGFAGGALASQAFNAIKSIGKGKGASGGGNAANNGKIRTASNPNVANPMNTLAGEANGIDASAVNTAAALGAGSAAAAGMSYGNGDENADDVRSELPGQMSFSLGEESSTSQQLTEGQNANSDDTTNENDRIRANPNEASNHTDANSNPTPNQTGIRQVPEPSFRDRANARKKELSNNLKKAVNRRYVAAGGMKGIAKNAAIGLGKGYIKAAGAVTGAALGASMGAIGGDLDNVWQGATAGAATGAFMGGRANKAISNAGNSAVGRFAGEVIHGDNYQKHQFIKQYMNNSENTQRILEKNPDISADELKTTKKAQAEMAYDAKLSDYSDIKGAVSVEKELREQGVANAHDIAVATAKMAKGYDNSTFTDKVKFENAQKQLQQKLEKQMRAQIEEQFANTQNETEKNRRLSQINAQSNEEARKTLDRISKIKGI